VLCVIGVTGLGACTDEPRRGDAGDSCTKTDDCSSGLSCIALVCSKRDGKSDTAADDEAGTDDASASCGARRDCAEGFACVSNACQPIRAGGSTSTRYSASGETCQASNDCEPGLICMMAVCRDGGLANLPHLPKTCHRVECASKDDCCATFMPNANCDTYKANCMMDPVFCNTYRSLCECQQDCMDELCVMGQPGCQADAECTSQQTPFCVNNKCHQCAQDSDCGASGIKCADGTCMAPCQSDENCPLLSACQDNACVETGCKDDRECAFIMKNPRATCRDKKCTAPCDSDAECANDKNSTGFDVCDNGECKFIGCETDSECRALLGLASQRGAVHAVCR
jgi:hypothetical protein